MPRLEDVPLADLRARLSRFENHREVTRLLAALLYKQGPSAPTIADWLDVRDATVYAWLDRLEAADAIDDALADDPRPGRPSRLDADERRAFERDLGESPRAHGYDEPSWTPALAKDHLQSRYGVDYSRRHVRRLVADASPVGREQDDAGVAGEGSACRSTGGTTDGGE